MAETIPCDLHVLSMPPAFALSQDQTLRFISSALTHRQSEQRPKHEQNHHPAHNQKHVQTKHIQTNTPAKHPKQAKHQATIPSTSRSQKPRHQQNNRPANHTHTHPQSPTGKKDAANLSLPQQIYLSMNNSHKAPTPRWTRRQPTCELAPPRRKPEKLIEDSSGRQLVISAGVDEPYLEAPTRSSSGVGKHSAFDFHRRRRSPQLLSVRSPWRSPCATSRYSWTCTAAGVSFWESAKRRTAKPTRCAAVGPWSHSSPRSKPRRWMGAPLPLERRPPKPIFRLS